LAGNQQQAFNIHLPLMPLKTSFERENNNDNKQQTGSLVQKTAMRTNTFKK